MRISRKQSRFLALLLLWWSWNLNPAFAQEFDPVNPTETIIEEIADGTATISQFAELSALAAQQQLTNDIVDLLGTDPAQNYFEANFKADGAYGEQKSGLILTDWETSARAMGTSGAVLAGAYALWRSRRRDYLTKLRAGDEALIMELFASEFSTGETTPATGEQWEEWAINHGLPGAGGLIASLFVIWQRKQTNQTAESNDTEDWLQGLYQVTDQKHWRNHTDSTGFYYTVHQEVQRKNEREYQATLAAQNIIAPDPIPSAEEVIGYNPDLSHTGGTSNDQNLLTYFSAGVTGTRHQKLDQIIQRVVNENAKRALAGKNPLNLLGVIEEYYKGNGFFMGYSPSWHGYYYNWTRQQAVNKYSNYAQNLSADTETQALIDEYEQQKSDYDTAQAAYLQTKNQIQGEIYNQNNDLIAEAYEHWLKFDQASQDSVSWDQNLTSLASTTAIAQENKRKAEQTAFESTLQNVLEMHTVEDLLSETISFDPVLTQTFDWFAAHPHQPAVMKAQQALVSIQGLNQTLEALETDLASTGLSFSEIENLNDQIETIKAERAVALSQVSNTRNLFLYSPKEVLDQSRTQNQIDLIATQDEFDNNLVHQWLEKQRLDQEFAERHGIMDRETYLTDEIAKLETALDQMKAQGLHDGQLMRPVSYGFGSDWGIGDFYGSEWMSINTVMEKLTELKAGNMPDHYWSPTYQYGRYHYGQFIPQTGDDELNFLHHWLKTQGTNASAMTSSGYQNKLQELEDREAVLTAQRQTQWEAAQTETLETKFSAEEITAYEALRDQVANYTEQQQALSEASEIAQAQFIGAVQSTNVARRQAVVAQNLLQPFTSDEFTRVSVEFGAPSVTLPDHLENVYFEAYRRFQNDEMAFIDEVDRLALQAQASDRRDEIADRGIPAEPVMTSEVRNYLDDPARTAADIDLEIQEVQDGIPLLSEMYADNPSYLSTAIEQAHAKIAALEQFKALGPIAAAQYQADLAVYNDTYNDILAEIDAELTAKYADPADHVVEYWEVAGHLLAKRTADNAAATAYTPTDPSQVELVEGYQAPTVEEVVQEYFEPTTTTPSLNVAYQAGHGAFNEALIEERKSFVLADYHEISPGDETPVYENRWEDPDWIMTMIDAIKSGEKDFLNFTMSPEAEKLALLNVAKREHSWWKFFSQENGNLGEFIDGVEESFAQQERESNIQGFLNAVQLVSTIQSPLTNIPGVIKFLSQEAVYEQIKEVFDIYNEFIGQAGTASQEEMQQLAIAFQERLSGVIDGISNVAVESNQTFEAWHFEYRGSKNSPLPSYTEVIQDESLWTEAGSLESLYHDNGVGENEKKFIHPDGREAVYTFNTSSEEWVIYNDPEYAGTYNFATPMAVSKVNILNYESYLIKGGLHTLLDVLPHKIYNGSIR